MGNGAKAQQKRDRNAEKAGKNGKGQSQLKTNEAAKNIACKTCFQTFLSTTRAPELEQHAVNKHSKTLADCFPTYVKT